MARGWYLQKPTYPIKVTIRTPGRPAAARRPRPWKRAAAGTARPPLRAASPGPRQPVAQAFGRLQRAGGGGKEGGAARVRAACHLVFRPPTRGAWRDAQLRAVAAPRLAWPCAHCSLLLAAPSRFAGVRLWSRATHAQLGGVSTSSSATALCRNVANRGGAPSCKPRVCTLGPCTAARFCCATASAQPAAYQCNLLLGQPSARRCFDRRRQAGAAAAGT